MNERICADCKKDLGCITHTYNSLRLCGVCFYERTAIGDIVFCRECCTTQYLHYLDNIQRHLLKEKLCFHCDFWLGKIQEYKSPKTVVVDGKHYRMGEKSCDKKAFNGFGGARFRIEFFDGRIEETDNLWCQGDIPEMFRARLPDNARFRKRQGSIECGNG